VPIIMLMARGGEIDRVECGCGSEKREVKRWTAALPMERAKPR
jgi:hypothetical protein